MNGVKGVGGGSGARFLSREQWGPNCWPLNQRRFMVLRDGELVAVGRWDDPAARRVLMAHTTARPLCAPVAPHHAITGAITVLCWTPGQRDDFHNWPPGVPWVDPRMCAGIG